MLLNTDTDICKETSIADVPPHAYPVLILSKHGLPRPVSVTLQTSVPDGVPNIQTLVLYPAVFSHDSGGREQAQPFLFLSDPSNSKNFPQITYSEGQMGPDPADNS